MKRLVFLLALAMCGCSPKVVQPYLSQIDTTIIARVDSVLVRDSIYVNVDRVIREKGDTVFVNVDRVEYRDRWRDRIVRDTLYRDVKITETVEVEKELSSWQKWRMGIGDAALGGLVLFAGIWLIRRRL